MKTFNFIYFFASIVFIVTSTFADELPKKEWLFVHSATTALSLTETSFIMPVWPEKPLNSNGSNQTYGYLTSKEFVSLWDGDKKSLFTHRPTLASFSWVEKDRPMNAEIIITSAKVTKNGRAVVYTFDRAEKIFEGTVTYANLLIDPGNSGACSISVLM